MSDGGVFDKLAKAKDRERRSVTIYLSRPLFEEFRELCEDRDVSASKVIEQLVRDLVESVKTPIQSADSAALPDEETQELLRILAGNPDLRDHVRTMGEIRTASNEKKARRRRG